MSTGAPPPYPTPPLFLHLSLEKTLSALPTIATLRRAEYVLEDGSMQDCVLKEYPLRTTTALKELKKEVQLLAGLHHPHVVELQALFEQPGASPSAYLQLRYYPRGDCTQWLAASVPDMPRRKTVLQQLVQVPHCIAATHCSCCSLLSLLAIACRRCTTSTRTAWRTATSSWRTC